MAKVKRKGRGKVQVGEAAERIAIATASLRIPFTYLYGNVGWRSKPVSEKDRSNRDMEKVQAKPQKNTKRRALLSNEE